MGLRDKTTTEGLKLLHNKFVVVPIDEAGSIVAFVFQRHYAQVLFKKLVLDNVNTIISTYMKTIKPVEKITSEKTSFLKNKLYLEVNEINKNLPNIYWTNKVHKNATKSKVYNCRT